MNQPDFIICAPLHLTNHSNGVLALVEFAAAIEKSGRKAFMCVNTVQDQREAILNIDFDNHTPVSDAERNFIDTINQLRQRYGFRMLKDFSREKIDQSYVVYPEVMRDNALGATRVIRYFLNKDGNLTNGAKVNVGENDFILAHSKNMHDKPHHVSFFAALNPIFNDAGTYPAEHRKMDITYIGKGALYGASGTIQNSVAITRAWPETKDQLAMLLRNCRFFYTADACSNLNTEALACGAIPVFLNNGPWTDREIDGSELGAFPRIRPGQPPIDKKFFTTFKIGRKAYLDRLRSVEKGWDASIAEMVRKVDAHFAEVGVGV